MDTFILSFCNNGINSCSFMRVNHCNFSHIIKYDRSITVYSDIAKKKAKLIFPPRNNAALWEDGRLQAGALKEWQEDTGYHNGHCQKQPCTAISNSLVVSYHCVTTMVRLVRHFPVSGLSIKFAS